MLKTLWLEKSVLSSVLVLSVTSLTLLTGCNSWEGKPYYQQKQSVLESENMEIALEGSNCVLKKGRGDLELSPDNEKLSIKDCAPFLIAKKMKSEFGGCQPREVVLDAASNKKLKLNRDCLCFVHREDHNQLSSMDFRWFGSLKECSQFFGEERQVKIKEIIDQVESSKNS